MGIENAIITRQYGKAKYESLKGEKMKVVNEAIDETPFDRESRYCIYEIITDREYAEDDLNEDEIKIRGVSENMRGAVDILQEITEEGKEGVIRDNEINEFIPIADIEQWLEFQNSVAEDSDDEPFDEKLNEGKADIYNEMEDDYFNALEKAEENGNARFVVAPDTEQEEEFDSFDQAKKYAQEIGVDKIYVDSFSECYGYYCDGEYTDYDEHILDLDRNIVENLKEDLNRSDVNKEVEKWAKDDFEQGLTLDPDDYDEFKHLLIDNHSELEKEPDESFRNWFNYYFDVLDNVRSDKHDDLDEKLIQGKSDATLKKNIATEVKAGKDPKQAYAIAKSIQKKNESLKENLSLITDGAGWTSDVVFGVTSDNKLFGYCSDSNTLSLFDNTLESQLEELENYISNEINDDETHSYFEGDIEEVRNTKLEDLVDPDDIEELLNDADIYDTISEYLDLTGDWNSDDEEYFDESLEEAYIEVGSKEEVEEYLDKYTKEFEKPAQLPTSSYDKEPLVIDLEDRRVGIVKDKDNNFVVSVETLWNNKEDIKKFKSLENAKDWFMYQTFPSKEQIEKKLDKAETEIQTESLNNPYSLKLSKSERSEAIKLAKCMLDKIDKEKEYTEEELYDLADPDDEETEDLLLYAVLHLQDKGLLDRTESGKLKRSALEEDAALLAALPEIMNAVNLGLGIKSLADELSESTKNEQLQQELNQEEIDVDKVVEIKDKIEDARYWEDQYIKDKEPAKAMYYQDEKEKLEENKENN